MDPVTDTSVGDLIARVASSLYYLANNILFPVAGAICIVIIIWGGIQIITGGTKGAETGKKTIIAALIGLIIVVLSYVILNTIVTIVS